GVRFRRLLLRWHGHRARSRTHCHRSLPLIVLTSRARCPRSKATGGNSPVSRLIFCLTFILLTRISYRRKSIPPACQTVNGRKPLVASVFGDFRILVCS